MGQVIIDDPQQLATPEALLDVHVDAADCAADAASIDERPNRVISSKQSSYP